MADNRKRHHNKKPFRDNYKPPFNDSVLNEPVTNLTLREETSSLLLGANISTVGDVLKRTEKDFYKIPHFNKKNLLDVKFAVKKRDLFLKPLPVETEQNQENKPVSSSENAEKGGQKPIERQNERRNDGNGRSGQDKNRPGKQNGKNEQQAKREARREEKNKPYVMVTAIERPPKPVKEPIKEEHDAYVKVNKGGLWGFRDRAGKTMPVEPIYDEVFSYKEDMCCVQKDEKFGFVNRQGEEVIPLIYDCATSFSEGLACVFKGDTCGYIDKEGNVVIDFKFDAGTPVINGECRVKKGGKWGELHIDNPNEIRWIV